MLYKLHFYFPPLVCGTNEQLSIRQRHILSRVSINENLSQKAKQNEQKFSTYMSNARAHTGCMQIFLKKDSRAPLSPTPQKQDRDILSMRSRTFRMNHHSSTGCH